MKRIGLIIFLALFACGVEAQEFDAKLLLGGNFSQIDGDQFAGYNKLGLNAGVGISRSYDNLWDLGFELRYSMKGSKKVVDPEVFTPTLTINYHYIEVPIMAYYKGFENIVLFGGPSLGINVYNQRNDNGFISEEAALNATEFALVIGGAYQLNDQWMLGVRHGYSLVSIRDYPLVVNSIRQFGRSGWYNRLFTLEAAYNLGS